MSAQVCYYCVKSATDIAKLALEYRKIQEIGKLTSEVEKFTRVAESIKSFCSLIRDDVQTMMHMYFKSAYENLNYALSSSGSNRLDYLRQAKNRFIDATAIEKNENLILSFIGLAICQSLTNDNDNCTISLNKIKRVYCELPNDNEELYSMAPFFDEFIRYFLPKMIINDLEENFMNPYTYRQEKDSFECTWYYMMTNEIFGRHLESDNYSIIKDLIKLYFRRYHDVLKVLGGFSYVEEVSQDRLKQVCKRILEEDFNKIKGEVISQFQIY